MSRSHHFTCSFISQGEYIGLCVRKHKDGPSRLIGFRSRKFYQSSTFVPVLHFLLLRSISYRSLSNGKVTAFSALTSCRVKSNGKFICLPLQGSPKFSLYLGKMLIPGPITGSRYLTLSDWHKTGSHAPNRTSGLSCGVGSFPRGQLFQITKRHPY